MAELSRDELKKRFRNGTLVKEQHFADLIDSFVHKSDPRSNGIINQAMIPSGGKYFSFFKDGINQQKNAPSFSFESSSDTTSDTDNLSITLPHKSGVKNLITFKSAPDQADGRLGRVGINTANPLLDLDVNGSVGMKSRVGRFRDPSVDPRQVVADGKWHTLLSNLSGISVFEIIIAAYCPKGKHALYYAVVTNVCGKGSSPKPVQQCYSRWWHRLQLQWTDSRQGKYGLKVRTATHYKTTPVICTRITNLWK